jgi:hypothetical protein
LIWGQTVGGLWEEKFWILAFSLFKPQNAEKWKDANSNYLILEIVYDKGFIGQEPDNT